MTIIRAGSYTVISNTVVDDNRLSFKARGLMLYLKGLPKGFDLSFRHLMAESDQDGETSLRSGLDELKKFGYLEVTRERGPDGRLGEAIWIIDEEGADDNHQSQAQE